MELLVSVRSQTTGAVNDIRLPLERPAIIGRGVENAIRVDGEAISREHVSISCRGNELSVSDLSSNGTLLNGVQLRRGTAEALKPGDVIGVPGWDVIVAGIASDGQSLSPVPANGPVAQTQTSGLMGTIANVVHSFTPLEQALTILSLSSLALLVMYLNS